MRYPPLRYYLGRVLCNMGGVSRTGPLREGFRQRKYLPMKGDSCPPCCFFLPQGARLQQSWHLGDVGYCCFSAMVLMEIEIELVVVDSSTQTCFIETQSLRMVSSSDSPQLRRLSRCFCIFFSFRDPAERVQKIGSDTFWASFFVKHPFSCPACIRKTSASADGSRPHQEKKGLSNKRALHHYHQSERQPPRL